MSLQDGKKGRCLVNKSLPCHIGLSKRISDNLLCKASNSNSSGQLRVGQKFLQSLWLKLPLAQNNLCTIEAHLGVASSGPPQKESVARASCS